MRSKKVYYMVFGLKDGTVFGVLPVRKPRKTKYSPAPKIDADGVCRFFVEDVVPRDLPDWEKSAFHTAIATALNVRRILREQLTGRLDALEKAFDYRGDVTITRKDKSTIEGYIFDRRGGATLNDSVVGLFPKGDPTRISIPYSDIATLSFTGRDTAAGKSWEAWMKKYAQKKAAGEKNIALEPEPLD